ncbi:MAG: DegT/DnrJ/EryC1/StrS family aminotransferase, partial [Plesiomonas sp.]
KRPHAYEFYHDEPGFNYRLPNLNAALGCAQMESLPNFLHKKRQLAEHYSHFFADSKLQFVQEPEHAHSNYWLNAVVCPNKAFRDQFLEKTNTAGVMTRPVWTLMHRLPMFEQMLRGKLDNAEWLEERVVNLPSPPTGAIA